MQENIENNPQTEVIDKQNAISDLTESLNIVFENIGKKIQPKIIDSPKFGKYKSWTFIKKFAKDGEDRMLQIVKYEGISKDRAIPNPYNISLWTRDPSLPQGEYKYKEQVIIYANQSVKAKIGHNTSDISLETLRKLAKKIEELTIVPNEANWEEFKNKGWEAFKNYQPGEEINGKPLNEFLAELKKTFGEKDVLSGPPYDFKNEKITGLEHKQRSNEISKENLGCIYIKRDKNKESETK